MTDKFQTVIFLVRHGETDHIFSSDMAKDDQRLLTKIGEQQVKKVGEYLKEFAPVAIYSSPMERTQQTAEIIRRVADIKKNVIIEPELHEIYDTRSYDSVGSRVGELMKKIIHTHRGEQVVCSTHMDVIESLLTSLNVTADEADFPCRAADSYRLVFADHTLVECLKVPVVHAVQS